MLQGTPKQRTIDSSLNMSTFKLPRSKQAVPLCTVEFSHQPATHGGGRSLTLVRQPGATVHGVARSQTRLSTHTE